jgi:uncharacterized protein
VLFVDTSYWVASSMRADRHHDEAVRLLRGRGDQRLVTSNHVLGETWTFVRRREGHRGAVALLDRVLETPRLRVEDVPPALEREAWSWLRRRDEREYSFVDATSFALMRRLKVREALAFDGDFTAAGFVELRA